MMLYFFFFWPMVGRVFPRCVIFRLAPTDFSAIPKFFPGAKEEQPLE
jgi:hypothetical protein